MRELKPLRPMKPLRPARSSSAGAAGSDSGNLEQELADDLGRLDATLKTAEQQRLDRESQRTLQYFEDESDSEFWFAVCFQTRDQKEAFLEATKWAPIELGKYLSGTKLAEMLGVKLPPGPKWRPVKQPKERWAKLARK